MRHGETAVTGAVNRVDFVEPFTFFERSAHGLRSYFSMDSGRRSSSPFAAGQSEQVMQFLNALSRFHQYSFRNVVLISMQRPDATLVAGFGSWKKRGRYVRKGELGIAIMAPISKRGSNQSEPSESESNDNGLADEDRGKQHNGVILLTHYRTAEAVAELLSFGDISILGPMIGVAHDFEKAGHSPFTTFFGRDRGEAGEHTRPVHHTFLCGVLKRAQSSGCEFIYLFEADCWSYCDRMDQ